MNEYTYVKELVNKTLFLSFSMLYKKKSMRTYGKKHVYRKKDLSLGEKRAIDKSLLSELWPETTVPTDPRMHNHDNIIKNW